MRYIRQERFIGERAQEKIKNKTVAIVGLGGLGSVASELLVRAGIKKLIIIDNDIIDICNLHRLSLVNEEDIGKNKVINLKEKLNDINKEIIIEDYFKTLDKKNINLIKSDLVLDCTDNLETRFLINKFCAKNKIPFVHASAIGNYGFIFNVIPGKVCFNCIFKKLDSHDNCANFGVLNTITHLIASVQISEAIKILTNGDYEKKLMYISLDDNKIIKINVNKNKSCRICFKHD